MKQNCWCTIDKNLSISAENATKWADFLDISEKYPVFYKKLAQISQKKQDFCRISWTYIHKNMANLAIFCRKIADFGLYLPEKWQLWDKNARNMAIYGHIWHIFVDATSIKSPGNPRNMPENEAFMPNFRHISEIYGSKWDKSSPKHPKSKDFSSTLYHQKYLEFGQFIAQMRDFWWNLH